MRLVFNIQEDNVPSFYSKAQETEYLDKEEKLKEIQELTL